MSDGGMLQGRAGSMGRAPDDDEEQLEIELTGIIANYSQNFIQRMNLTMQLR